MLEALQDSRLAHFIGESQMITAALSSLHLVGFTLVMGSALMFNLRMLGATLREVTAASIIRSASRVLVTGLVISITTGTLLFVPRAAGASANSIFRLKLTLLAGALLLHFVIQRRVASTSADGSMAQRLSGAAGVGVWTALALAGCAFILLE